MNYFKHNYNIKRIISDYLSINKNTVKEINKINIKKILFFGKYCEWELANLTFTPKDFKNKEYIDYLYKEYGSY